MFFLCIICDWLTRKSGKCEMCGRAVTRLESADVLDAAYDQLLREMYHG